MSEAIFSMVGILVVSSIAVAVSTFALCAAAWACCALYKSAKDEGFIK